MRFWRPGTIDPLRRILDANLNRAREGLRVLEDAARFGLDDASLCQRAKAIRHFLRDLAQSVPGGGLSLVASRDTPGDVGTGVVGAGEGDRRGLGALAGAGAARAGEALRAIEEVCKVLVPARAHEAEAARYALYELDKRIALALGTGRAVQWRLCVLITASLCTHHPWEEVARRSIEGGADCLQLREKDLDDAELLARARTLVAIARGRACVIINDRADIALACGADGVHLGQGDLSVEQVRQLAGDRLLVGVSTHDPDELARALRDGADYVGLGAMYPTGTKPRETSGPAYLARALEYLADKRVLPHLAIGGITIENIASLRRAGAQGVAVSSAVCSNPDPQGVCRALCG